ncbi:MAG: alpha/beta fold hydrolase [Planctomycetota bacterium]|jgi:haloalkane dehalogenase|nr:alpha/beta fold hydrolase [Planctomycetota bacterium]
MVNVLSGPDDFPLPGDPAAAKLARRTVDQRHWAKRIGVPLAGLNAPAFRSLYPFESRLHTLGSLNYHYLDEGEGEPVVMLHGNPTWSFFYRDLILGLRDRHRCLVPDHLGCGLSEKPPDHPYCLENHIANLESWLAGILPLESWPGGRFNLVVHDWGGPIGFGYALRNPGRVLRLVVLNTSIFTSGTMPRRIRLCRLPFLGEALVRHLNLFARGAARLTTVRPLSANVRAGYLLPYNSWKNRVGIQAFLRDIPLEIDSPSRRLLRSLGDEAPFRLAEKPMLIQWGMNDWCFTPAFLGIWRQSFPDAKVGEYRAGHYLLEDAGREIVKSVGEFLKGPLP